MNLPSFLKFQRTAKRTTSSVVMLSEYKHFTLHRIVSQLTILILCIVIFLIGHFIYTRVYTVIGKTQELIGTETDPSSEPIRFDLKEKIFQAWSTDETFSTPTTTIHNPF